MLSCRHLARRARARDVAAVGGGSATAGSSRAWACAWVSQSLLPLPPRVQACPRQLRLWPAPHSRPSRPSRGSTACTCGPSRSGRARCAPVVLRSWQSLGPVHRVRARALACQSWRIAATGSRRVARRTGMKQAMTAITTRLAATPASVCRSFTVTPARPLEKTDPHSLVQAIPTARPTRQLQGDPPRHEPDHVPPAGAERQADAYLLGALADRVRRDGVQTQRRQHRPRWSVRTRASISRYSADPLSIANHLRHGPHPLERQVGIEALHLGRSSAATASVAISLRTSSAAFASGIERSGR